MGLSQSLIMFIAGLALVLAALLVYWALFLTEGVYLGERVVVWLYDLYARRYDRIKDWVMEDEIDYLAQPFAAAVGVVRQPPLILDVAAGTARLTRCVRAADLLPDAHWVLLDASGPMLRQGRHKLGDLQRITFIQHTACPLPFLDATFDVVSCLEALEFMPDPAATLAELVRVLRPGGLLLITNRIGGGARLMPNKVWSRAEVYDLLKKMGQKRIEIRSFLVDYQWVSSTKAGNFAPPGRANAAALVASLEAMANLG